jgi:TonB family protein
MKKLTLILLLSSFFLNGFSQDLMYEVRGKYDKPIKKEALTEAQLLGDFIAGYPSNWVKDYISVEISTKENGDTHKALSLSETLSDEQKNILSKVDLSTEIEINVWYKYPNSITDKLENRNVFVKMTVIPEVEAEFMGGYKQLKQYLKRQMIDKIAKKTPDEFQKGKVVFTVNEQGKITNAEIGLSTGDKKTDMLLLKTICKMPKWKPAQNAKGKNVKQRFEFSMGRGGC